MMQVKGRAGPHWLRYARNDPLKSITSAHRKAATAASRTPEVRRAASELAAKIDDCGNNPDAAAEAHELLVAAVSRALAASLPDAPEIVHDFAVQAAVFAAGAHAFVMSPGTDLDEWISSMPDEALDGLRNAMVETGRSMGCDEAPSVHVAAALRPPGTSLLGSAHRDALRVFVVPGPFQRLGMAGRVVMCCPGISQVFPATRLFLRIREFPPQIAATVELATQLLRLPGELPAHRLKSGNLVLPLLERAAGPWASRAGQEPLELAAASFPGGVHAPAAGHCLDLARDRAQQVAAGEPRGIAVVEPGAPLTDPEQSRRSAVPGSLQGPGDPGLGFVRLRNQPAGRQDSRITVAPMAPALLDPMIVIVELDLDGDGRIAAVACPGRCATPSSVASGTGAGPCRRSTCV